MSDERKPFSNTVETAVSFVQLQSQLQRIEENLNSIKEGQVVMLSDINKVKDSMNDPKEGIYSRLKDVEQKVKDHEKIISLEYEIKVLNEWKAGIVKLAWTAGAGVFGSIALTLWNLIKGA